MEKCWAPNAKNRPQIAEVVGFLLAQKFLLTLEDRFRLEYPRADPNLQVSQELLHILARSGFEPAMVNSRYYFINWSLL
jgi:hypothetical protein